MDTNAVRYNEAVVLYQRSQFEAAFKHIEPVLDTLPPDIEAINLAAICALQCNQSDVAKALWSRIIETHPDHAAALSNLASLHVRLDEYDEAESLYRRVIALDPEAFSALNNYGDLLCRQRRFEEAEAVLCQALRIESNRYETLLNLALVLRESDRLHEAADIFAQALAFRPDDLNGLLQQGQNWLMLERFAEAESVYRRMLELDPRNHPACHNLAIALDRQQRTHEAEDTYRSALSLNVESPDTLINLAEMICRVAGREEEAKEYLERALRIRPDSASALNNLANVMRAFGDQAQAEAHLRRAVTIDPHHPDIRFNLAQVQLKRGLYEEGWHGHETRFDERKSSRLRLPEGITHRRWCGEDLRGASFLLVHEQGLGDTIQFIRYVPLLRQRGVREVIVACPPPLHALVRSVEGVDACVALDELPAAPEHAFWCYMLSLPYFFQTSVETVPANVPYLHASPERIEYWRKRLPEARFKVGLVWSGDPRPQDPGCSEMDRHRSIRAAQYLPLLQIDDIQFVSLQKGAAQSQLLDLPVRCRPIDPMHEIDDFADTAALISTLNLVITVDTSVAHLCGALGQPVWILSRFNGCWRWIVDRDDSPWYPSARIFHQRRAGDWEDVIVRVRQALVAQIR